MPDETVSSFLKEFRTILSEHNEMTRTALEEAKAQFSTTLNDFRASYEPIDRARVAIMERLDRQQDTMTKLGAELDAVIELLKDTAPAGLLLRIRQLEEEVRELKRDRNVPD